MRTQTVVAAFMVLVSTSIYAEDQNKLSALGNNQFSDNSGFTDNFPCNEGGSPLVIYSTSANNKVNISSKAAITPAYIAPGFNASILNIEPIQQVDETSKKYLMVQSRSPSENWISFNLERFDKQRFFVNSVQFPPVHVKNNKQADKKKFVVQSFLQVDRQSAQFLSKFPVRNYGFAQDFRQSVESNVKHLQGNFAAWSQATEWGDATKPIFGQVNYIFTSLPTEDDPNSYNGYGVWVCGNPQPNDSNE